MPSERLYTFLLMRIGGKPARVVVWDTQDVTVGRAPESDVVIDDPEVSRNHAHFYRTPSGYAVKNMSVSNPTFVNDQTVDAHELSSGDVVRLAETEFVFYRVPQNPATLRLQMEYASQLKNFGPKVAAGDGEATILGLMDTVEGDDTFEVRPASDFEHELHGLESPPAPARNLDAELAEEGLEELDLPGKAGMDAWALEEAGDASALSLHLEVSGLTGPQRASLEALLGKVIELPRLRIRIKADDLG
jgi:predicted component of type VI protein secretion system